MKDDFEQWCVRLWRTRRTDVYILLFGAAFGALFDWDIVEIGIFLLFLWSIIGPLSSRSLAAPALVFLSATPLLLAFGREEQAEAFAVYAYYFLVMAVIRAMVELAQERSMEAQDVKE